MKKFVSLLLAVPMLTALLCACGEPKEPVKSDAVESEASEKSDAAEDPVIVYGEGDEYLIYEAGKTTDYKVVYPGQCDNHVSGAAGLLADQLVEATGKRVTVNDDEYLGKPNDKPEILVGATDRPESAKALEKLGENEYIVYFDGKNIVINADTPWGIRYAARRFFEECIDGKTSCSLKAGFTMHEAYEIPETEKLLAGIRHGMNVELVDTTVARPREDFEMIKEAGFDHFRLPVTFTDFLDENGVFDEEKMKPLDESIGYAADTGLLAILDLHFWEDLSTMEEGDEEAPALFLSVWRQIAERYKDMPVNIAYEFLNEPQAGYGLSEDLWNELQMEAYRIVRSVDEDRIVVFSPYGWNEARYLERLELPVNDDAVLIDFHNYSPHAFTHQGVTMWENDRMGYGYSVFMEFKKNIDIAAAFLAETGYHAFLGEFSVSRFKTTDYDVEGFLSDVTAYMDMKGQPWTFWEFDRFWKVYDQETKSWIVPRLSGLRSEHKVFMAEDSPYIID